MTAAYKKPQTEPCSWCGGYGVRADGDGEAYECSTCGGSGAVEARDAKGRFLPWVTVPAEHDFAIREVRDGLIEIDGVCYAPSRPYDGSLEGQRFAFGRYWLGDEIDRSNPAGLAFVCLWGTEAAYLSRGALAIGPIAFEWWREVMEA